MIRWIYQNLHLKRKRICRRILVEPPLPKSILFHTVSRISGECNRTSLGEKMVCQKCDVMPQGAFRSAGDDYSLSIKLQNHEFLKLTDVPEDTISYGLDECFYECSNCAQNWVHERPDGNYRGVWSVLE